MTALGCKGKGCFWPQLAIQKTVLDHFNFKMASKGVAKQQKEIFSPLRFLPVTFQKDSNLLILGVKTF